MGGVLIGHKIQVREQLLSGEVIGRFDKHVSLGRFLSITFVDPNLSNATPRDIVDAVAAV